MGKRLLIVDDPAATLLFLPNRLEKPGFEVATASNGLEGLEMLRTESINGILRDLEMPIMDGLTMLDRLRQQSITDPVIMMSADPTRSTMSNAIKNGGRDYLFLPISGEILKHKCLRIFF